MDRLIFGYVALLLGAVGMIAILYERRRRSFEPQPTEDTVFRCRKCAYVYTDDEDVEVSRCPQCGTSNEAVEF
jgi:predicted Zn-ribbon and HTH transcriptional regulator